MRIVRTHEASFEEMFRRIQNRGIMVDDEIWKVVKEILDAVALRGDEALFDYTLKFDGHAVSADNVELSGRQKAEALTKVDAREREVLELAAERIERFHRRQVMEGWLSADEEGVQLGQRVTPLARVGIYAPGGLAAYPSTVLMASIPARIAGVGELILASPVRADQMNPLIVAAAVIGGVDRIFRIGGAQAVAALAFGTASVPQVDKIVGPGNAYVTLAKKMVFGQVGIDMIAGPSEILVIADGGADPSFVAADLLSQAEHDELSSAILITPEETLAGRVAAQMERQLERLERRSVAECSLRDYGAAIVTRDLDEAASVANRFAPEHLELMVENPRQLLEKIRNAGAVFLGYHTPEIMGDYIAGPNHILPTGGTARFASPLSVYDFLKRTSVLSFSALSLAKYGPQAERFARMEGLDGHGRAVAIRLAQKKP
ncbi:MAG: histidinol dehydrogenase [Deltaproteobacteria bacterium]|nr:histidinol dehydrogenase [Deltaproteobacteria bacterium]